MLTAQQAAGNSSALTDEQRQERLVLGAMIKTVKTPEKLPQIVKRIGESYANDKLTKEQTQELTDLVDKRGKELSK